VDQLACTRSGCHSIEKIRETRKTDGKYRFSHDKHVGEEVGGIKLACGTCHSHIKGGEHFEVNGNICITCHLLERDVDGRVERGPEGKSVPAIIRMAVREGDAGASADLKDAGAAAQSEARIAHDQALMV
jgi:hypothetical protein